MFSYFYFIGGFQFGCEKYVSETVRSNEIQQGWDGGVYGDVEKKDSHVFI
jgi:hypothetical protein